MKRLYKSRHDKVLDGVCGGIACYFKIDPIIVRLIWVIVTIVGGITIFFSIFIYILAAIIIPREPLHPTRYAEQPTTSEPEPIDPEQEDPYPNEELAPVDLDRMSKEKQSKATIFFGALLILFGSVLLLDRLSVFSFFDWFMTTFSLFRGISQFLIPSLLIFAGIMILLRSRKE